jgi:c-di-GMP-binding flagellar brake protein YcgR
VLNLSGGGCMLRLDAPPAPLIGDRLDIHLPLGADVPLLILRARVVHVHRPDLERPFLGLAFENRSRKTEDQLVRYVFARQAELLRNGRLWNPTGGGAPAMPPPRPPAGEAPD